MLVELSQNDINDLRALISSPSLAIQANQALRVAQLQALLSNVKASDEVERLSARCLELEKQIGDAIAARDNAELRRGIMQRRADELEAALIHTGCTCGAQLGMMHADACPAGGQPS